jgi:hypothetical protein
LFENKHWRFALIHVVDAAIDAMTEIIKQIERAARKASLDIKSP